MKIAIAGAGLTGAYLYRVLNNQGHEIDIFGKRSETKCGITPCAWGISRGFVELVEASGLDPKGYVLQCGDHLFIDEMRLRADTMTLDKPRLISDLLQGARIRYSQLDLANYDRIIDATGVCRALLPAIEDDIILPAMQRRIRTNARLENRIKLGGIGYAWCFPLSDSEYHIGCGSLVSEPNQIMEQLGWIRDYTSEAVGTIVCACSGKVRLTGPQYSLPFVTDDAAGRVWGVGEAIGCVAPLAGDGIVTGMRSAQILLRCWDDPDRYKEEILREFKWMKSERRVIDKLRRGEDLEMNDALPLRENSRRMGMQVGLRQAWTLLKRLT